MRFRRWTIVLAVCLMTATVSAQNVVNPGFEADLFINFPGYVEKNYPITGWKTTVLVPGGAAGINPGHDFSPFADNGKIPEGQHVAFIQNNAALSQVVTGFLAGAQYTVSFHENARRANVPKLTVKMNGATIVPEHPVEVVGDSAPYRKMNSHRFTATAPEMELSFVHRVDRNEDHTVLLDNVVIQKVGKEPRSILPPMLLVYEGFEYAPGTALNSVAATGLGWMGNYHVEPYLTVGEGLVAGPGMTHKTIRSTGNKLSIVNSRSMRSLDLSALPSLLKTSDGKVIRAPQGSIWLSVLAQRDASKSGFFGLSLFESENEVLFLGVARSDARWKIGGAGGSAGFAAADVSQPTLLVVRIDWSQELSDLNPDVAYLWVNPNVSSEDLDLQTAQAVSARPAGYGFNTISFRGDGAGHVDELRVGTTLSSVLPKLTKDR